MNEVPPEILHNPTLYPFFKDCIGAIDGTHVVVHVPASKQVAYRGKQTIPTQNVMAACSFDMRFTYVYTGWEGTANDSRVLNDCLSNPANSFPTPPEGKFYVLDSGYMNIPGFLTPYRGERYHLQEYRGHARRPTNIEEWFNYRHSQLRNVIERCFGVLKAQFPILKAMPPFKVQTQRYIPTACCTIHNFIRSKDATDSLNASWNEVQIFEDPSHGEDASSSSQNPTEFDLSSSQAREMARVRDEIARQIWQSVST